MALKDMHEDVLLRIGNVPPYLGDDVACTVAVGRRGEL